MFNVSRTILFFALMCLCFSCQDQHEFQDLRIEKVNVPASSSSRFPSLHSNGETLYMTWIHDQDSLSQLRYASLDGTNWSTPITVAQGIDWFVNWADFPSLNSVNSNHLLTYYLPKSGVGTYAYDVAVKQSIDRGKSWSDPIIPHRDSTETEHGFVSLFSMSTTHMGVIWLDGRNAAQHESSHDHASEANMTLRFASIDQEGKLDQEVLLDSRVCSCCQTDATAFEDGYIVVYRDRSEREIRDISYVLLKNGEWSDPQKLHQDNWEIAACPVNGPAVAAHKQTIAVAWYTQADAVAKVQLIFSKNGGQSFSNPIAIDNGRPLGRVDVELLDDNHAILTWLETSNDTCHLMMKVIHKNGEIVLEKRISEIDPKRASGFPRIAQHNGAIYVAFTKIGKEKDLAQIELMKLVFF